MLHLKLLYSLCHLLIGPSHYLTSKIRASETDEYNCIHTIHLFIDSTYSRAPLWNCPTWLFNRVQIKKYFSRCGFQTMRMRLTGTFSKDENSPDLTQTFCIRSSGVNAQVSAFSTLSRWFLWIFTYYMHLLWALTLHQCWGFEV